MTTSQESKTTTIFIGRWTPKILFSLKQRPHRHGELGRNLGGVSQRRLTNAAQSGIHRIGRETRNEIESDCCRVFLDSTGKEHHHSAAGDVPLGKAIPQACEC